MTVIRVDAGSKSYDVLIGPVEAAIERINALAKSATPILISDPRVFALHGVPIAVNQIEPEAVLYVGPIPGHLDE